MSRNSRSQAAVARRDAYKAYKGLSPRKKIEIYRARKAHEAFLRKLVYGELPQETKKD